MRKGEEIERKAYLKKDLNGQVITSQYTKSRLEYTGRKSRRSAKSHRMWSFRRKYV